MKKKKVLGVDAPQKSEKKEESKMKPYQLIKTAPQLKKFADEGGLLGVTSDGALYVYDNGAKRINAQQAAEMLEMPLEFIQEVIESRGECELPSVEEVLEEVQEEAQVETVVHEDESPVEEDTEKSEESQEEEAEEEVTEEPEPDPFEEFQKHLENLDEKFKMLNDEIIKLKEDNVKLQEEVNSLKL